MLALQIPTDGSPLASGVAAYKRGEFGPAFLCFSDLAAAGDPVAKTWLGSMYAHGEGVVASLSKAFALYLEGAEDGNALAQTNVGAMLAMGQGVEQDVSAGVDWLTRAAGQGDLFAQYNLATLYSKGRDAKGGGVDADPQAAARWYRAAAEAGHYPSQARLGFLYANGIGVEKDRVEAYVWLSLAAQHGVGNALNALEAIAGQMSADEKRDGAARVNGWRSQTAETSRHARLNPTPG